MHEITFRLSFAIDELYVFLSRHFIATYWFKKNMCEKYCVRSIIRQSTSKIRDALVEYTRWNTISNLLKCITINAWNNSDISYHIWKTLLENYWLISSTMKSETIKCMRNLVISFNSNLNFMLKQIYRVENRYSREIAYIYNYMAMIHVYLPAASIVLVSMILISIWCDNRFKLIRTCEQQPC